MEERKNDPETFHQLGVTPNTFNRPNLNCYLSYFLRQQTLIIRLSRLRGIGEVTILKMLSNFPPEGKWFLPKNEIDGREKNDAETFHQLDITPNTFN